MKVHSLTTTSRERAIVKQSLPCLFSFKAKARLSRCFRYVILVIFSLQCLTLVFTGAGKAAWRLQKMLPSLRIPHSTFGWLRYTRRTQINRSLLAASVAPRTWCGGYAGRICKEAAKDSRKSPVRKSADRKSRTSVRRFDVSVRNVLWHGQHSDRFMGSRLIIQVVYYYPRITFHFISLIHPQYNQ